MADSKRKCLEVEGYVHDVSEVLQGKSSNVRYFTALLQEANQNSRVVVFDVQKHNSFQCAARDRSPVKLSFVEHSPSKQHNNTNDLLVKSGTKVSVLRRLEFAREDGLTSRAPVRSLSDIQRDVREYQRVTVKVKVLRMLQDKESVVRGQKLRRKSVVVADSSDLILLSLWGDHVMTIGEWYILTNVSVRVFKGMTSLSTTMQTSLSVVENSGPAKEFVEEDVTSVVGEIVEAEVKVDHFCPKHHLLENINVATHMTRCTKCASFCKTSKSRVEMRGHIGITVDFVQRRIPLDDAEIRELLNLNGRENLDSHALAAKLLVHDDLKVEMWREFITRVLFVKKDDAVDAPKDGSDEAAAAVSNGEKDEFDNLDSLFD
ncbi:uncharacterized protein isoform X2 [Danio rerio]|nr:uncharacterized protein LOC100538256 isoform X2 [Danio rerio]|eukprot:XP_017212030.1 uncharacterized protein LOC100538256 isoform X2 [Danio rerio]